MYQGTDTAFDLAKKYKLKIAYGTDVLFDAQKAAQPGAQLMKMKRWFTNAEILQMATGNNGELLALSGKRSPYSGKLGVVEEGALADLILVDGNPIQTLELLTEPEKNLLLVMKNGTIYKDLLSK
jgi:imidazolonepropionase-like amidohydrolase